MKLFAGTQQRRWLVWPIDDRASQFARTLKVSKLLAQVLINRGIADASDARVFLRPKLSELIEPEKMPGLVGALPRIKNAIKTGEKITVYGDYDVDGITGVAIVWQVLRLLGADVDYYIPHRIDEGYGLNAEAVKSIAEAGSRLLITVDCGANALDCAALAARLGLDLIITDHHQPGSELPAACAIVHPALDASYANQDSSGSMVAFKLAWAIASEFSDSAKLSGQMQEFMLNATSLAAIGTVADIMDLRGENRVLTSYGLKVLDRCSLPGVAALIETANLASKGVGSIDIGFRLAPMLNAAGRMGHARRALELLITDNPAEARQTAEYLKQQNNRRQQLERKISRQACEIITGRGLDGPERKTIVLAETGWHTGVIGIVASRIVDRFARPTIMINLGQDERNTAAQGSARSTANFDILSAIKACSKHLVSFGGHRAAAGLKIEPEKVEAFAADFEVYAQQNISDTDYIETLNIDAVTDLGALSKNSVDELQALAPFGQGNPEPVFATMGVSLASHPRTCGSGGSHLQLAVTDHTATFRCIGFGMGKLQKQLLEQQYFNIAYRPQINTYNGYSNVELVISDIQFS